MLAIVGEVVACFRRCSGECGSCGSSSSGCNCCNSFALVVVVVVSVVVAVVLLSSLFVLLLRFIIHSLHLAWNLTIATAQLRTKMTMAARMEPAHMVPALSAPALWLRAAL